MNVSQEEIERKTKIVQTYLRQNPNLTNQELNSLLKLGGFEAGLSADKISALRPPEQQELKVAPVNSRRPWTKEEEGLLQDLTMAEFCTLAYQASSTAFQASAEAVYLVFNKQNPDGERTKRAIIDRALGIAHELEVGMVKEPKEPGRVRANLGLRFIVFALHALADGLRGRDNQTADVEETPTT